MSCLDLLELHDIFELLDVSIWMMLVITINDFIFMIIMNSLLVNLVEREYFVKSQLFSDNLVSVY